MKLLSLLILVFFCLAVAACGPAPSPAPSPQPAAATAVAAAPTAVPSATVPLPSPSATATAAPTQTSTPAPRACSPLPGYAIADLPAMIFNPYAPPPPGKDDPHEGIDLAVVLPGSRVALKGSPVAAALDGRVVVVLRDRFPYGNAVIFETPLESAPPALALPTPSPTLSPRSALTCPALPPPAYDSARRSLYIVYAHLQSAPALQPGDEVACGQEFGVIGDTGNALNPHLHFEVRVGPGGAALGSMAHYDPSASPEEMATYCFWRVSGLFQLIDPAIVLGYTSP